MYKKRHVMTKREMKEFQNRFMEKEPSRNHLFSQHIGLSKDQTRTERSSNFLVVGITGSGKTPHYVLNNMFQMNSGMVITDPNGYLFATYGPFLQHNGYNVMSFHITDPMYSSRYNPLDHVYDKDGKISENKVDTIVEQYIENAGYGHEVDGDPFWKTTQSAFVHALIYYVLEKDEITDKSFGTVYDIAFKAWDEFDQFPVIDKLSLTKEMYQWMERRVSGDLKTTAVLYYDTFLKAPRQTQKAVLKTTYRDLQCFNKPEIRTMTTTEYVGTDKNIDFDDLAQTPTALFVCVPQAHYPYNFLISLFYMQMFSRMYELGEQILNSKWFLEDELQRPMFNAFNTLEELQDFKEHIAEEHIVAKEYINSTKIYQICYKDKVYRRSTDRNILVDLIRNVKELKEYQNTRLPGLPMHVEFYLDDFKNIGTIPHFRTILATNRKYRMGIHILVQDLAQLETMYGDELEIFMAVISVKILYGTILQQDKEWFVKESGMIYSKQEAAEICKKAELYCKKHHMPYSGTPEICYATVLNTSDLEKIFKKGECLILIRDMLPIIDRKPNVRECRRFVDYDKFVRDREFSDFLKFYKEESEEL